MMIDTYLIMSLLAAVFQFIAAYLVYEIYLFNRMTKGWLALVVAFVIQGIRRLIPLTKESVLINLVDTEIVDHILMFTISLLILVGLWSMKKRFENFDVVEKNSEKFVRKIKI